MIKTYPKVTVQCDNDPAHTIDIELGWVHDDWDNIRDKMFSIYSDKHIREELLEEGWEDVGGDRWYCPECAQRGEQGGRE